MASKNSWHHWQFEFESRPGLTTQVYRNYCAALERMADFFGQETDVSHIFHADVLRYRDHRGKHVLSPTVKTDIKIGQAFYNYLALRGVVESFFNPFKNVKFREKEKPPDESGGTIDGQPN